MLKDRHLRESRIATLIKEVEMMLVMMMVMEEVVVMKTEILLNVHIDFFSFKINFNRGDFSRDCPRTRQLQGGLDTRKKRLSGWFLSFCLPILLLVH